MFPCFFYLEYYNEFYRLEKANLPRGGDAKSWICQSDAYRLTDRQTAEIFLFGGLFVKGGVPQSLQISNIHQVEYSQKIAFKRRINNV